MNGTLIRGLVAVIAVIVSVVGKLTPGEVTGVIIPLSVFILADAHVEASKKS